MSEKGRYIQVWRALTLTVVVLASILGGVAALRWYTEMQHIEPAVVVPQVHLNTTEPTLLWPPYGQAAIATEQQGIIVTHGVQTPHPTASTAKVIAVLAILEKKPLHSGEQGPTLTLTEADVRSYEQYIARNGSNTPVYAGLQLTQYQAIQSIMLASSNNMADTLAIWAFGSIDAYHTYANEMVERLGAKQTTIGDDASGLSPATKSTAEDMARISLAALEQPVIAEIAAQQAADIPFAGMIRNTNRLLGHDEEIVGLKTGETVEAGGNFLLAAKHSSQGETQYAVVVVYGAELARVAIQDSYELYRSAAPYIRFEEIIPAGTVVARYTREHKAVAQAVIQQAVKSWTWASERFQPIVTVDSITSSIANCTTIGSLRYDTILVPVVATRTNERC